MTAMKSNSMQFLLLCVCLFLAGVTSYAVPDLLVVGSSLSVSPNPITAGNTLTVGISIKNNGSSTATASTTRLQIKNAALTATVADQDYSTPSILAGQTIPQNYSIRIPANTTPGTYNAYVVLDRYSTSGETNGANNYGSSNVFTVSAPGNAPTATTGAAINITANSALLTGTVNPNGGAPAVAFEYGTTTSYGNNTSPAIVLNPGNTDVFVSGNANFLIPDTLYHNRVVAVNAGNLVGRGADATFRTLPVSTPPTAITNAPSYVASHSARMNATVNPNGIGTSAWFEYGTTSGYGSATPAAYLGAGTSNISTSEDLASLDAATTYHYRVVAVNNNGDIANGGDVSFMTATDRPSVITLPATSVTGNSAQLNGQVTNTGGFAVDERRFDWGTTLDGVWPPTNWTNQVIVSGNHFSFNLTGLSPNTFYHFRAWAHNNLGWASGGIASFVIPENLGVVAWGRNDDGRSTVPSGLSNVVQIAGGYSHNLALKSDGTVVAWGYNGDGETDVPSGLSNVFQIAAGYSHNLALKSDGTVVAWGDNSQGQTTVPFGLSNVVQVAASADHSMALKSDGTVVAWGDNSSGQTNVPSDLSNVFQIAAGEWHSLALKSDGTVLAWGNNVGGQATVPSGLSNVVQIAGGGVHSLALKSDGTVVGWGNNGEGQTNVPSGLSNVVQIAAGYYYSLALKSDGTIVGWGDDWHGQTDAPSGNFVQVSANVDHNVALVKNGPIGVTPDILTAFGSVQVGAHADRTFIVFNRGPFASSGTASVAAPFSIVGSANYSLGPGQSQTITVRFTPSAPGDYSAYVSFTGSGGQTRQVTGTGFGNLISLTGTITGVITNPGGTRLNNVTVLAESASSTQSDAGVGIPTTSGGSGTNAGTYTLRLAPGNYRITASPPGPPYAFNTGEVNATVTAGNTTIVNFVLNPISTVNQPCTLSAQDTPVVLVRGFGADKDWDGGEENEWWDVTRGLEANGFSEIWDCNNPEVGILDGKGHVINGQLSIKDNVSRTVAGVSTGLLPYVRAQVLKYKNHNGCFPPTINIVAHSMGGLITRLALSGTDHIDCTDPVSGQTFPVKIGKVIMLGTPNAGTVAAASMVAGSSPLKYLPSWSGVQYWDSTSDLTPLHIRGNFDSSWPSSVRLYLYAGTGGLYGNELSGILALSSAFIKHFNILLPPEADDDGVVPRPSVSGTYHYRERGWPFALKTGWCFTAHPVKDVYDLEINGTPLSGLNHLDLLKDPATITWVTQMLTDASPAVAALPTSNTRPARASPAPAPASGAINSPPMQLIENAGGTVVVGASAQISVTSDASSGLSFHIFVTAGDAAITLKNPAGVVIDSTTPETDPNVQYSTLAGDGGSLAIGYQITNPTPGIWQVFVDSRSIAETEVGYNLTVFGDSQLSLIPQTELLFNQGQDVPVACLLADFGTDPATPLPRAAITASVQLPDGTTTSLSLFDDGLHSEGGPNDGTYAAILSAIQQAGSYSVTFRATGNRPNGTPFQRVTTTAFSVSTQHAQILGDPTYQVIDTNGDGIGDHLQMTCWVNPTVAGNYIVSGTLNGSGYVTAASARFYSEGAAPTAVNLLFDLNDFGGGGLLHVESLQLFEVTSTSTAWLDTYRGTSQIQAGPTLTTQLQDQFVIEGSQVAFSVAATGGANLRYQWRFNEVDISGATNPSLILSNLSANQSGTYSVMVGDESGWVTSWASLGVRIASHFGEWQSFRFTPSELLDPTLTARDADPDGDGIPNLLEYAFHLDPKSPDNGPMTASLIESDGIDSYLTFTFRQLYYTYTDLRYTVGVSDDLKDWDWTENEIEYREWVETGDGAVQVKVRLITPVGALPKRKFLKLRVTCRPQTINDWQSLFFTPAERLDANNSGLNADPDRDGVRNILEYAFGSNPKEANITILPQTFISQEGNNSYLNLTYRQADAYDLSIEVGVSDDLTLWDWTGTQINWISRAPASDGLADEVTVRLSTPINLLPRPKFLKLRVTSQP